MKTRVTIIQGQRLGGEGWKGVSGANAAACIIVETGSGRSVSTLAGSSLAQPGWRPESYRICSV